MRQSAPLRFLLLVGLAAACFLAACSASTPPVITGPATPTVDESPRFEERRGELPNGLKVIVRRDPRSSLAAVVTRVDAGYLNEEADEAGISHLLEHMILQGTPSHPGAGELAGELRGLGASWNAATTYDHTESWMVLPATAVDDGIRLAAEIYAQPLLPAEQLAREKLRVRQEIQRKLEDPQAFARDTLLQLVYRRNRMGRGAEEGLAQLDALTREQLQRFHEDHYRPTNTTVGVVGDIDPDAVMAMLEAAFGSVERGELRLHDGPPEVEPDGLAYEAVIEHYDPHLTVVGFPLPGAGHEDLPAIELLSALLVDGQASRLRLPLLRRGALTFDLESRVVRYRGAGFLEITMATPNKIDDQALRTLFVEIERIRRFGVGEAEIRAARRLLVNRWRQSQQDVLSEARELVAGPSRQGGMGPHRWDDQDSEDLQRVAARWLTIPRAGVVQLLDETWMQARPFYTRLDSASMQAHLEGAVLAAFAQLEPFVVPPPPPSTQSRLELAGWAREFDHESAGSQGRLFRKRFENGTTLLVQEDASLPSVNLSLWFRGGRVAEVQNTAGSTAMLQKLMRMETMNRSEGPLGRELDGLGTRIEELRTLDGFGYGAEVHRGELPYLFDILYDMVAHPRFEVRGVERAKQIQTREIQSYDRQLHRRSAQLLRRAAWGEHGYAQPEFGTQESVKAMRTDRLDELQIEACDPSSAVIVATGSVDAELLAEFVAIYLEEWSDLSDLFPEGADEYFVSEFIDPLPAVEPGAEAEIHRDSPLAALRLGFPSPGPRDAGYAALDVLEAWLGAPDGPVWNQLREQGSALRFAVDTQGGALGALLSAYLVCEAPESSEVESEMLDALRAAAQETPTDGDSARAKLAAAMQLRIRSQSLADRAEALAEQEILGLDPRSVEERAAEREAVSPDELGRLLREVIGEGACAVGRVQGLQEETE